MLHFFLQLPPVGLPQPTSTIPELPPGPSLDRVRGPVEIPMLENWQVALIAALSLIVIGLLGWKLLQYFRAQTNQNPVASPYDSAIAELKSAAKLTADDDERFAVISSLALRRYFETGKGMRVLSKTTDEFLHSISDHSLLSPDSRKSLTAFMQNCDRVKFAKAPLTEAERQKLTESALTLIRHCETTQPETDTKETQP